MIESIVPFTKIELLPRLEETNREVTDYFASIPASAFFEHPPEVWSPAENVVHLIKSVSPVAKAMKLPKILLAVLFGPSRAASRRFDQIKEDYRRVLAGGMRAPRQFVPIVNNAPADGVRAQQEILEKWAQTGNNLLAIVQKWREGDLDKYRLPHPALGKLTIREMLFFTLYHNLHHVNNVRKWRGEAVISL